MPESVTERAARLLRQVEAIGVTEPSARQFLATLASLPPQEMAQMKSEVDSLAFLMPDAFALRRTGRKKPATMLQTDVRLLELLAKRGRATVPELWRAWSTRTAATKDPWPVMSEVSLRSRVPVLERWQLVRPTGDAQNVRGSIRGSRVWELKTDYSAVDLAGTFPVSEPARVLLVSLVSTPDSDMIVQGALRYVAEAAGIEL